MCRLLGINRDTIPDCYPIPRIDDLIDMVGRCKGKVFTTLDLMKGYHQIRMEADSKSKTAFTCHACRIVPIQENAIWTDKRTRHIPAVNESVIQW